MNENFLKEFYIGRTVFLEPVIFTEEHVKNPLKTLNLLETEFKIKYLEVDENFYLYVRFHYKNRDLDEFNYREFFIENKNNIDNIIGCNRCNTKEKYKLFLDKNDNLKIYQNLHYSNLISQKEQELENLKTKLLTINNQ